MSDSERNEFFIQHMGLRDYEGEPNSFESIIKNYRGAQEMDTLLLRDGEIAVINDNRLGLTPEEVEAMTLPELEAHLSQKHPEAEKEKTIPTFKEFMGLASDTDTKLRVELRGSSPEQSAKLAHRAVEQIAEMNAAGGFSKNPDFPKKQLRFVTFSIPALQEVQRAAEEKDIPASTGLFWPSAESWKMASGLFDDEAVNKVPDLDAREWNERGILVAKHYGLSEIELQPHVITPEHVKLAHELELEIGSSIIRDKRDQAPDFDQHAYKESEAKRLAEMGLDHILTEK